jgi:2-dehydropantoate 2-reductase
LIITVIETGCACRLIMIKNYAILGTGAIGGYCAVKLSQADFLIHCLLRSDFLHVKQHGLTLVSDKEKITVPIKSYQNIHNMPVCDAILVALKTTENALLKEMLPKIMHSKSVVIILQNGIGIEQEVARFIEPNKIIGGSCMLKVSRESPGVIRHFGLNSIELAQYYPDHRQEGVTHHIEELAENFRKAGIDSITTEHLPSMRWKKLVGNIAINGLSVVLKCVYSRINPTSGKFRIIMCYY